MLYPLMNWACPFFSNYTIHRDTHNARTLVPMNTHANPNFRSIFEDCATNLQDWRSHAYKAQTSLNPEKLAPTGSQTQDLKCYGSYMPFHNWACPFDFMYFWISLLMEEQ
jgi:hypothetical protein